MVTWAEELMRNNCRIEDLFNQLDRDGDGNLDYAEFVQMLGIA